MSKTSKTKVKKLTVKFIRNLWQCHTHAIHHACTHKQRSHRWSFHMSDMTRYQTFSPQRTLFPPGCRNWRKLVIEMRTKLNSTPFWVEVCLGTKRTQPAAASLSYNLDRHLSTVISSFVLASFPWSTSCVTRTRLRLRSDCIVLDAESGASAGIEHPCESSASTRPLQNTVYIRSMSPQTYNRCIVDAVDHSSIQLMNYAVEYQWQK